MHLIRDRAQDARPAVFGYSLRALGYKARVPLVLAIINSTKNIEIVFHTEQLKVKHFLHHPLRVRHSIALPKPTSTIMKTFAISTAAAFFAALSPAVAAPVNVEARQAQVQVIFIGAANAAFAQIFPADGSVVPISKWCRAVSMHSFEPMTKALFLPCT